MDTPEADLTTRTLLKKVLRTEPTRSPVLSQATNNVEAQHSNTTEDLSLLSAGPTSSFNLSLKTPHVELLTGRQGMQRKAVKRKAISVEAFEEGARNYLEKKRGADTGKGSDSLCKALSETGALEKFTLGLSASTMPDITEIMMNNTELYAQPKSSRGGPPDSASLLSEHRNDASLAQGQQPAELERHGEQSLEEVQAGEGAEDEEEEEAGAEKTGVKTPESRLQEEEEEMAQEEEEEAESEKTGVKTPKSRLHEDEEMEEEEEAESEKTGVKTPKSRLHEDEEMEEEEAEAGKTGVKTPESRLREEEERAQEEELEDGGEIGDEHSDAARSEAEQAAEGPDSEAEGGLGELEGESEGWSVTEERERAKEGEDDENEADMPEEVEEEVGWVGSESVSAREEEEEEEEEEPQQQTEHAARRATRSQAGIKENVSESLHEAKGYRSVAEVQEPADTETESPAVLSGTLSRRRASSLGQKSKTRPSEPATGSDSPLGSLGGSPKALSSPPRQQRRTLVGVDESRGAVTRSEAAADSSSPLSSAGGASWSKGLSSPLAKQSSLSLDADVPNSEGTDMLRDQEAKHLSSHHTGEAWDKDDSACAPELEDSGPQRAPLPSTSAAGVSNHLRRNEEEQDLSTQWTEVTENSIDDAGSSRSEELTLKTPAFLRDKKPAITPSALPTPTFLQEKKQRKVPPPAQLKPPRKPRAAKQKEDPSLPKAYVMSVFSHFAKTKVSRDVYPVLQEILDKYFERLVDDLEAYANHAKRKTIEKQDVELLLRRQGLVPDGVPVNVLIERYLPMEYRKLLIPVATSGNKVFPKQ
nr:PREDICTED: centromere protein T [Lepisosteus oculatus]